MRGIAFYNIPTTLLSQVDASIGGKTAIDKAGVKNIVGAFYPPIGVLIDSMVLKTLDKRQLYAGLVEALKIGATSDASLFEQIEKRALSGLSGQDIESLTRMLAEICKNMKQRSDSSEQK